MFKPKIFSGTILGWLLIAMLGVEVYGATTASAAFDTPATDGVLGLPWGATREAVIQVMREKGVANIQVDADSNNQSETISGDGSFAGYPARISCRLINNALWRSEAGQICRTTNYAAGIETYLQIRGRIFKDAPSWEEQKDSKDSPDRIELYLENQETGRGDNITAAIEFRFISGRGAIEASFENSTLKPRLLEPTLKRACLKAAIRGIELEIARYQSWIDLREKKKVDDPGALPGLKANLQVLKADLQKYRAMKPEDYQLPEKVETNVRIEGAAALNSILYVDGMSKSGPWYHLTGIAGDDFKVLKPGTKYKTTFYKVYPRNYFNMESFYVYVADLAAEDFSKQLFGDL